MQEPQFWANDREKDKWKDEEALLKRFDGIKELPMPPKPVAHSRSLREMS